MPIIREIIFGSARRGASLRKLLELSGITEEQLKDGALHVPFEQAQRVWKHAVSLTNDPLLGLHIGEDATTSMVGLTGHLMQTSPDLKTAFEKVCSFNQTFTDMFQYSITQTGNLMQLEYKPSALWVKLYPETAAQAVDQALSGTLNVFQLLSGKRIVPMEVELSLGNKKYRKEYERVLGAAVTFNRDASRLHFDEKQLMEPVLSYDKKLFSIFNNLLTLQKKKLKKKNSLALEIKQILREVYQYRAPSLEAIAAQLNLVPRTLQRKLGEEGTSYRALVLEMRYELSSQLLKAGHARIKSVAGMLGYSEPSAFRRAFKNWTRKTPKEFRKSS